MQLTNWFSCWNFNVLSSQVKGSEVLTYDGVPVGYALCPAETVRFCDLDYV